MSLKSLMCNILNKLRGATQAIQPRATRKLAFSSRPTPAPVRAPARPVGVEADFNLEEAVRLRSRGLSNRQIARAINSSKDTVRRRLADYDATPRPPAPEPPAPVQSPVAPPISTRPVDRPMVMPAITLQSPAQPPVWSDNIARVSRDYPERVGDRRLFCVQPHHLSQCTSNRQFAVAFDRWDDRFAGKDIWARFDEFLVIVEAADTENGPWLDSIVRRWAGESCWARQGDVSSITQCAIRATRDELDFIRLTVDAIPGLCARPYREQSMVSLGDWSVPPTGCGGGRPRECLWRGPDGGAPSDPDSNDGSRACTG